MSAHQWPWRHSAFTTHSLTPAKRTEKDYIVLVHARAVQGMRAALGHQVGQVVCYREKRWLGMHKQVGTRARNHQRPT